MLLLITVFHSSEKYFVSLTIFFLNFKFFIFRSALEAYGSSQATGPMGAVATCLYHTATATWELTAALDPQPTE